MRKPKGDTHRLLLWRNGQKEREEAGLIALRWVDELEETLPRCGCKRHDAEDLAQATMLAFFEKPREWRPDSTLRGWLHATARNKALTRLRARGRRPRQRPDDGILADLVPGTAPPAAAEPRDPHPGPATEARRCEVIAAVRASRARLTPAEAEAVWRTKALDETSQEAADGMGRAAGTVRALVCRGVEKLKRHLGPLAS